MADVELLNEVKTRLAITGDYHDALITEYIKDVKDYLVDAGISSETVDSDKSIGVISRGVADLWNFGAGDGKFSELFYQRTIQLICKEAANNV